MLFEDIIKNNETDYKTIDKHIKLNPNSAINLNAVQIAFKLQTNEIINFNELINMCVLDFIKSINNISSSGNDNEAIQYINQLRNELKQGGL